MEGSGEEGREKGDDDLKSEVSQLQLTGQIQPTFCLQIKFIGTLI